MLLRTAARMAMLAATAFAGWDRTISTGKGGFADSPPPHPLAYFEVDPCQRPASDQIRVAMECQPGAPTPEELERQAKTTAELFEIGDIGEFAIYDLWYSRGLYSQDAQSRTSRDLRSVLIKTGEDEYREIDVYRVGGTQFPASEVVDLDGEKILIVEEHDGGNNSNIFKTPYLVRASGLEKPDLSAVSKAVSDLMPPKNMSVRHWNDDYKAMRVAIDFYRNDTNEPPVTVRERGCITVTYRFFQGHAVVTGSNYQPFACGQ